MIEKDENTVNANMTVGRNAVTELLRSGRDIDKIFLKDGEWEGSIKNIAAMAKERGIPVQVKRYVSGGNDAKNIQRTGVGVRCLAFSLPTRYLHAPVSVGKYSDVEAMVELLSAMLETM